MKRPPEVAMPAAVAAVVPAHRYWFVIGGQAVRCFSPYRPSRDVTGLLAAKTHAMLDRGLRRDFLDFYVKLQSHALGLVDCLRALRTVYRTDVNDALVLRAFTYFDDAETCVPISGEGPEDWRLVKEFFLNAVAALLVPPLVPLFIQSQCVDVRE